MNLLSILHIFGVNTPTYWSERSYRNLIFTFYSQAVYMHDSSKGGKQSRLNCFKVIQAASLRTDVWHTRNHYQRKRPYLTESRSRTTDGHIGLAPNITVNEVVPWDSCMLWSWGLWSLSLLCSQQSTVRLEIWKYMQSFLDQTSISNMHKYINILLYRWSVDYVSRWPS